MSSESIHIENLSRNVTKQCLINEFSRIGSVESARIKLDDVTFEHSGKAVVMMENMSDNSKAVDILNGLDMKGQEIELFIQ